MTAVGWDEERTGRGLWQVLWAGTQSGGGERGLWVLSSLLVSLGRIHKLWREGQGCLQTNPLCAENIDFFRD